MEKMPKKGKPSLLFHSEKCDGIEEVNVDFDYAHSMQPMEITITMYLILMLKSIQKMYYDTVNIIRMLWIF